MSLALYSILWFNTDLEIKKLYKHNLIVPGGGDDGAACRIGSGAGAATTGSGAAFSSSTFGAAASAPPEAESKICVSQKYATNDEKRNLRGNGPSAGPKNSQDEY